MALVGCLCVSVPESQDVGFVRVEFSGKPWNKVKGRKSARNESAVKSTVTFNNMSKELWESVCTSSNLQALSSKPKDVRSNSCTGWVYGKL